MEVAETRTSVDRSIVSHPSLRNGVKSDLRACHVAFVGTKMTTKARDLLSSGWHARCHAGWHPACRLHGCSTNRRVAPLTVARAFTLACNALLLRPLTKTKPPRSGSARSTVVPTQDRSLEPRAIFRGRRDQGPLRKQLRTQLLTHVRASVGTLLPTIRSRRRYSFDEFVARV
jgi:hypothetical protein